MELLGKPSNSEILSWGNSMARDFLEQVSVGKKKGLSTMFGHLSPAALDLLKNLLSYNPNNRFTA